MGEVVRLVLEVEEVMETDSVRLESSVWLGNKRHRALLSGWRFSWTELDKKNRDKTTSKTKTGFFFFSSSFSNLYS